MSKNYPTTLAYSKIHFLFYFSLVNTMNKKKILIVVILVICELTRYTNTYTDNSAEILVLRF